MISAEQALAFALAALVVIAVPGPSVVFVIGRALSYGRTVAMASVAGNTLGLLTVVALVSLGLGVIVSESILVFTAIKYAGAAYLVYLGIQAIRHRDGFQSGGGGPHRHLPPFRALRQGYVVGVSNPKGFMLFGALLPQFVDRGAGHVQVQMLCLGVLAATIGLACDTAWAFAASRVRSWFGASRRRGEAMGAAGGLSMVGLGVMLAVSGRPE